MTNTKYCAVPSVDALADYMSLIYLENYNTLENQAQYLNAGASSSTNCITPTSQQPSPNSSNLDSRVGATSTNYHSFTTSSPLSYNRAALNPHDSSSPAFQTSHDRLPANLNEVRALKGPAPSECLGDIWRSVSYISQDPSLLCQYACSVYGSKQLRRLVKELRNCEFISFLNLTEALAKQFLDLAFNSFGRGVILQCFKYLGIEGKRVLSCKVVQHCLSMAIDISGCILLDECIFYMEEFYKDQVLYIIQKYSRLLALDCYGTYVVQNAVSTDYKHFSSSIVENLRYIIPMLSIQKEGSHLVEKCIDCFSTRRIVVEVILQLRRDWLKVLACDKFGNFVIQKALSSTLERPEFLGLHWSLQKALRPLEECLRRHKFGRNVAYGLVV